MKNQIDVAVVGELNVDIILNSIQSFPEIGKEFIAENMTLKLGSSSAIFACNLGIIGANIAFFGNIGDDDFGNYIIKCLNNKNIDILNVKRTIVLKTGATIVLNYGQDRANITYPGAMNNFSINDIDFDVIEKCKHFHFSLYFLQPQLRGDVVDLFKTAKGFVLTTSLDPQWDPQEKWDMPLTDILTYVDVFLPNNVEIQLLTGTSNTISAIEKIKDFSNCIVVKNGSAGANGCVKEDIVYQNIFLNKHVVDCIWAGDSFNAGFIYKNINKCSMSKCLEFGTLIGAISTTMPGGTGVFENMKLIKKML